MMDHRDAVPVGRLCFQPVVWNAMAGGGFGFHARCCWFGEEELWP